MVFFFSSLHSILVKMNLQPKNAGKILSKCKHRAQARCSMGLYNPCLLISVIQVALCAVVGSEPQANHMYQFPNTYACRWLQAQQIGKMLSN